MSSVLPTSSTAPTTGVCESSAPTGAHPSPNPRPGPAPDHIDHSNGATCAPDLATAARTLWDDVAGDDINTIRNGTAPPLMRALAVGDLATNVADPLKGGAEALGKAAVKGVVKDAVHAATDGAVHSAVHTAGATTHATTHASSAAINPASHAAAGSQHAAATSVILSTSKASSKKLKANLLASGKTMKPGDHAHHLVAGNAKAARPARAVLAKHNIDINDAVNGQFLPGAVHARLHTKQYLGGVNRILQRAKTKQDVHQALQHISNRITTSGKFP